MTQCFLTIALPFKNGHRPAVEARLDTLGNPPNEEIRRLLDEPAFVHFMSIGVVPGEPMSHLLIEATADGESELGTIEKLVAAIGTDLQTVLASAGFTVDSAELKDFLARHRLRVGQGWFSQPGLNFSGTPGMTVRRIRLEADLARRIGAMLDGLPATRSARDALEFVRTRLWADESAKWAFIAEAAPMLDAVPPPSKAVLPFSWAAVSALLWPFLVLAAIAFGLAWYGAGLAIAVLVGVAVIAAELALGFLAYLRLRRKEASDPTDDAPPSAAAVDAMMRRESYARHNHMFAASVMKPGPLRRIGLRIGLWTAGQLALHFSRPGFLTALGVIHFARWVLLPGTDKLLFFSNYDGAWETYLEDFIARSYKGVNGIWSNTSGFPRTRNLFFDGARDGNRLKRWVRRQQFPSRFWYSAYPDLTLTRIRTNAAIRQGITLASTEAEARDWLSCFGSAPAPSTLIETPQVPTLLLGGLRRLHYGACLCLRLSGNVEKAKALLAALEPRLSYGESRAASKASLLGLAATGLRKLGLTHEQIATFPVAFQDGSAAPWRARAVGDTGQNAPENWYWGAPHNDVDCVLLVYARENTTLDELLASHVAKIRELGHEIVQEVRFKPLPLDGKEKPTEPFGYADGISQPVIRVAPAAAKADPRQVMAPGEFILGYPDNLGYVAPGPTISAHDDPDNVLPAVGIVEGQRPNFAQRCPSAEHDLGRNGTFLVLRQLEQDVDGFENFLGEAATALARDHRAPPLAHAALADWIGAKLVGRWKNGSALVRHPHAPGPPVVGGRLENDFLFAEDAAGRHCPFGAHIRRANPRESFEPGSEEQLGVTNRHRILRVGRSYEPQNGWRKPGLVFMCLNGDIERQFEFLQQTWLLGSSFHGLEKESDAMLGGPNGGGIFTIPTPDGPLRLRGLRDFVTVRGSGYFFMPGRAALGFLAHGSRRDAAGMARGAIVVQPSPTKTPVTDGNAMEPQPQLAPAEDERER